MMDPTKQPGIFFEGVYLSKLVFRRTSHSPKELSFGLGLDLTRHIEKKEGGGKRLVLSLKADPMRGIKDPPFELEIELVGVFEAEPESNLAIEEFAEKQAPAHLVPYLRELISSVTARTDLPALMLPPVNVNALLGPGKSDKPKKKLPTPSEK